MAKLTRDHTLALAGVREIEDFLAATLSRPASLVSVGLRD